MTLTRVISLAILIVGVAAIHIVISLRPEYAFFVGSPAGVAREFAALWSTGELPRAIAVTTLEAILGFLAGSVIGSVLGLSFWYSPLAFGIARPYLTALGALPVFALGPVLIYWFGTGMVSKVVLGFLATFTIAVMQSYTGAMQADGTLLRMTQAFGGGKATAFRYVIVPSAIIWVISGIRINIGMALLAAIVGEFISSRMGLGHMIIVAEGLYNVNQIWVGTLSILGIALVFNAAVAPAERWATRWKVT